MSHASWFSETIAFVMRKEAEGSRKVGRKEVLEKRGGMTQWKLAALDIIVSKCLYSPHQHSIFA